MTHLYPAEPGNSDELFEGDLDPDPVSESQARSSVHGREFDAEALEFLELAGAHIVDRYVRVFEYPLDALVEGTNGARFYVDAHGSPDRTLRSQAGMRRQDTMLKFGFKALRLHHRGCPHPLLLVTSHMPAANLSSAFLLRECNDAVFDAVATVGDFAGVRRLHHYFTTTPAPTEPLPAPWRDRPEQLSLDDIDPFDDGEDGTDA